MSLRAQKTWCLSSPRNRLFCGIEPYNWRRRYKDFCLNQRSTGTNFIRLIDLEKAVSVAHRYKVKVHVAVNAFFYLEQQYNMAEKIIKNILDIGADGIILADPVLLDTNLCKSRNESDLKYLLKNKDVVIGTDAVVFDSSVVKFGKCLGATRIVFPRAMTLQEIEEAVTSDRSIEY